MNQYAIYLRKSRADVEAEARGEGETLARHRRALTRLAEKCGYPVADIYEEIVSGDSISERPQMRALLANVEAGVYRGVIVNDADRLARGDSMDQGIVKQAFFCTGTLIVTPFKIYDPADESDEDFFDFGLFMARFEYRKIKQRMQTGRLRSAAEGNYLAARVTYGYTKEKRANRGGFTLTPDPVKSEIVRMIFRLYADGENGETFGAERIARRLNDMGIKTDLGKPFTAGYVRLILQNPAYIGTIIWNKNVKRVRVLGGVKTAVREANLNPVIVENAHPPIIERDLFDRVQRLFAAHAKLPKSDQLPVLNPLCGLVFCARCGKRMQIHYSVHSPKYLRCPTHGCPTSRTRLSIVEDALLDALRGWSIEYAEPAPEPAPHDGRAAVIEAMRRNLAALSRQRDALCDLLEQGVYSPDEYVRRRDSLAVRMESVSTRLADLQSAPAPEILRPDLPRIQSVLDAYPLAETAELKNQLLKSCVAKILYDKTHPCHRGENPADYLTLTVYPIFGQMAAAPPLK